MYCLAICAAFALGAQMELDIAANRGAKKYSRYEYLLRILWSIAIYFFKLTPRRSFATRNFILKLFGAKIGHHVHIYSSATIYYPWNFSIGDYSSIGEWVLIYNLGSVAIGSKSTVSHKAHLCAGTHDYSSADLPLIKKGIEISDQVWICAEAFIGPGVIVGTGAVVGARAVATRNVQPWAIVAGNPATFIKTRKVK